LAIEGILPCFEKNGHFFFRNWEKNKEEVDLICEKKVKKSKKCDEAFLQIAKDS